MGKNIFREFLGNPTLEENLPDRSSILERLFLKIVMKHYIEHVPSFGSYIDLGCGSQPQNAVLFSKHFSEVFCLDISPRNIKIAKERARKEGHHFVF